MIAGVDEAGRGPLAGPVVAAAVVLCSPAPKGLADSKVISAKRRGILETEIVSRCHWAVGVVDVEDIDRLNIFGATMLAMTLAVEGLCAKIGCDPGELLIDGNKTPEGRTPGWHWPARAIVGGDATTPCISAASIIAKEHRDRLMRAAHIDWPHYDWASNKGYGSARHLAALREYGASPLHRRSFAPVRNVIFATS